MTEIDYLKCKLEDAEKAFDKLHKRHIELLKKQGELEKKNEQLRQQVQNAKEIAVKNDMQYQICRKEKEDFQDMCEQLRKELDNFKPVMFQDMRKGTVILYSKGDMNEQKTKNTEI